MNAGPHVSDYGDGCAHFYDELYAPPGRDLIQVLAGLANGGPVLDLGVGTGRVALPLADTGLPVSGIEASGAMRDALQAKPGSDRVQLHAGDFADVEVPGCFSLICVLTSTFLLLPDPETQARCIVRAARKLVPAGFLVVEAALPAPGSARVETLRHRVITRTGEQIYRVRLCHVATEALDSMAAAAGLSLRWRWKNWRREPFGSSDSQHVSVYASG